MPPVLEEKMTSGQHFTRLHRQLDRGQDWLDALRQRAIDHFDRVGFPSPKAELWRWTNLQPITRTKFEPAEPASADEVLPVIDQYTFRRDGALELVLVNGHFNAELSQLGRLPRGVKVMSLAEALTSESATIEKHLARLASIERNPFVALNTGFIQDGAYIFLPAGTRLDRPISILAVSTGGAGPVVAHPRVLVVTEDRVHATVVESYVGDRANGRVYFTNAVTEFALGDDCHIDYCRLQQESPAAYHVSTLQVELGRATNFVSHAVNIGAKISRNDLNCVMNGEYAYATLNGLVLMSGEQHCDNHTLLHHEKANCPSHELYKHVLDGKSSCVFKGQIFVQHDAQKTDSKQTSKSLLLSDDAYMNSQPALEIHADDVKCTHGSTTGPVDEDMVFYLRTRGVGLDAARHLLTYAFAADITRRIKVESFRTRIEDFMAAQHGLPQDLRITDVTGFDDAAL